MNLRDCTANLTYFEQSEECDRTCIDAGYAGGDCVANRETENQPDYCGCTEKEN